MLISQMTALDTNSTCNTFSNKCLGLLESNGYMKDLFHYLDPYAKTLQAAIDKAENESITEDIGEIDSAFGDDVKIFRTVTNAKAAAAVLGGESTACAAIAVVFNEVERFEELPRKRQIEVMNSIKRNLSSEEMVNNLQVGGVKSLYTPIVEKHDKLVSLMAKKAGTSSDLKDLPSPSDAAKEVRPILSKIYKHIEDYADIGNDVYEKLLRDIQEDLKPITILMEANQTRNKNRKESSTEA